MPIANYSQSRGLGSTFIMEHSTLNSFPYCVLSAGLGHSERIGRRSADCYLQFSPNTVPLCTKHIFKHRYDRFALSTRINICTYMQYYQLYCKFEEHRGKVTEKSSGSDDWLTDFCVATRTDQARPRNWAGYQPIWVTANKCTWWSSGYNIIMWIYSRPMRYIMGNILFYYLPGEVLWSGGVWLVWYKTWW